MLNTQVYEVVFPDIKLKHYSAKIIAEDRYAQADQEGHK
jgi:hypothetical protein